VKKYVITEFFKTINKETELFKKFSKMRKKYRAVKLDEKASYDFLTKDLIPFARSLGFVFSIEDYIKYCKEEEKKSLTDEELALVSGGSGGFFSVKTLGLCGALLTFAGTGSMQNIGSLIGYNSNEQKESSAFKESEIERVEAFLQKMLQDGNFVQKHEKARGVLEALEEYKRVMDANIKYINNKLLSYVDFKVKGRLAKEDGVGKICEKLTQIVGTQEINKDNNYIAFLGTLEVLEGTIENLFIDLEYVLPEITISHMPELAEPDIKKLGICEEVKRFYCANMVLDSVLRRIPTELTKKDVVPDIESDGTQLPDRKHSYTFVYQEEPFDMEVPDNATVADTKELVATRFKTLAENVKLLHCGKEMKDTLVLSKQRIRPPNRIVVYIRDMRSILLQSCGAGWSRNTPKPDNYLELLQELKERSGQDARICARVLLYYDYDFDRALEELLNLDQ